MGYPEIRTLKNNPKLEGMAYFIPDVVFSTATGVELKMQLMIPWNDDTTQPEIPRRPLIVFLQGSGWTFPNVNYQIPQLCEYARMGYVVATITHRSIKDGYPAPAFLQDAKTAIRFLRKNADVYGIDPNRICFWGTSSGGNTALLVTMTGDDPRYKPKNIQSSQIASLLPLNASALRIIRLVKTIKPGLKCRMLTILSALLSGRSSRTCRPGKTNEPAAYHRKGKISPLLLLHGDADR